MPVARLPIPGSPTPATVHFPHVSGVSDPGYIQYLPRVSGVTDPGYKIRTASGVADPGYIHPING